MDNTSKTAGTAEALPLLSAGKLEIPSKEHITKVTAALYERSANRQDTEQFVFPKELYEELLDELQLLESDPAPDSHAVEIGTIHIWYETRTFRLCIFRNVTKEGYDLSWNGFRVRQSGEDEWGHVVFKHMISRGKTISQSTGG